MVAKLPLFVRSFVLDFVETSIALVFALNLIVPGTFDQAKAEGIVVGAAVLSALVSAIRRASPAFLIWLAGVLQTPVNPPTSVQINVEDKQ